MLCLYCVVNNVRGSTTVKHTSDADISQENTEVLSYISLAYIT